MSERLCRESLSALRKATVVEFHHRLDSSFIIARLVDPLQKFTPFERLAFNTTTATGDRVRLIDCNSMIGGVDENGGTWGVPRPPTATAFTTVEGRDSTWQSIAGLLGTGDLLTLNWAAGNNTDDIVSAGLQRDDLFLTVKSDLRERTYYVAVRVALNENRMIKRRG